MTKEKFEDVDFNLDIDSAPQEVLQWSKDHLGEGDKDIKIYELREFIFERGDVTPHRTDDTYLLKFLRARNFNVESAYRLLVNYYTFRENYPIHYENVDPLELEFIGVDDVIQVLPYRDGERRIMITKFGNWNPNLHSVDDLFSGTLFVLEIGSLEPRAQILGGICILDFKNITLSHAWQVTPNVAKKVVDIMVTSFPLKVHAVHITFESKVFDVMYNIFQPFLNKKMREKIFFHGSDMSTLHQHINPKLLPKRYGGTRPNYKYNRWIDNVKTNSKIVEELRSLGYKITQDALERQYTNPGDKKSVSEDSE